MMPYVKSLGGIGIFVLLVFTMASAILPLSGEITGAEAGGVDENTPDGPDFDKQIAPIFEAKCNRCHGEKSRRGGLDMRTVASLLKGGNSGSAFKPGNAEKSLLVELIHFREMPPKKVEPRVAPKEFDLIKAWIDSLPAPKP